MSAIKTVVHVTTQNKAKLTEKMQYPGSAILFESHYPQNHCQLSIKTKQTVSIHKYSTNQPKYPEQNRQYHK